MKMLRIFIGCAFLAAGAVALGVALSGDFGPWPRRVVAPLALVGVLSLVIDWARALPAISHAFTEGWRGSGDRPPRAVVYGSRRESSEEES